MFYNFPSQNCSIMFRSDFASFPQRCLVHQGASFPLFLTGFSHFLFLFPFHPFLLFCYAKLFYVNCFKLNFLRWFTIYRYRGLFQATFQIDSIISGKSWCHYLCWTGNAANGLQNGSLKWVASYSMAKLNSIIMRITCAIMIGHSIG